MILLLLAFACRDAAAPAVDTVRLEQLAKVSDAFLTHMVEVPFDGTMADDPILAPELGTPDGLLLLEAVAYCALSYEDQLEVEIDGFTRRFPGWLNGAPDWATGPCDLGCQQLVTSCILARTNVYGITVDILFLGERYPGADQELMDYFPTREGAFYGNYFVTPFEIHTCVGDGVDPLHRAFRTCTHEDNACLIEHVGACGTFDGQKQEAVAHGVCDGLDPSGRWYVGCRDRAPDASGAFPPDTTVYDVATTINIQGSSLGDPEACGTP
jgi:hypothetical protein